MFSIISKNNETKCIKKYIKILSINENSFENINRLKLLNIIIFLNRFIIFQKIILSINHFINQIREFVNSNLLRKINSIENARISKLIIIKITRFLIYINTLSSCL